MLPVHDTKVFNVLKEISSLEITFSDLSNTILSGENDLIINSNPL